MLCLWTGGWYKGTSVHSPLLILHPLMSISSSCTICTYPIFLHQFWPLWADSTMSTSTTLPNSVAHTTNLLHPLVMYWSRPTWAYGIPVRGHPFVSLLPLSSPTLHLFICIPPPHPCTIFKDHTQGRRLLGPNVRWLSRSRLTDSRWLPASPPAHTSTASDRLRTHWDRSAWYYGTLRHHVDNHIWEAWY
jgi:hypothetical protein